MTRATKYRGLVMKPWEVRSIQLSGATMFLRPIERMRRFGKIREFGPTGTPGYDWHFRDKEARWQDLRTSRLLEYAPYRVGQRLYVKETFHAFDDGRVRYRADGGVLSSEDCFDAPWTPSVNMPQRYSRLTLEITDVRVVRLWDLTEADARAVGIVDGGCLSCGNDEPCGCDNPQPSARDAFAHLWDETAKPEHKWVINPFCWAVTHQRVDP